VQGGFVALSKDKIPPIPLHKTWPGVPAPSRLGPWTWSQEPRTVGIGSRTHVLLIALPRHSWDWLVLLGPRSVDQQQRLLYLIATVEPQEGGPEARYHGAPRLGQRAFSVGVVNSLGGNFVWMYISTHAPILS
jgi:hypothetical protein